MRVTFENQGTNTYLVYEISAEDELDSMSLGMLTNNKIPGIAEATFLQVDTTKYIKFNVTAKVSVSQLFSGPVNKKRLVGVFSGIIDAMLSAEDYMLDVDSILLDLDYIFADVTTCKAVLVCLPVMNMERKNPELGVFFKNIMFNTQFDQTENCDHVAQIINYLNVNPVLSLSDFKALLDDMTKPKEEKKVPQVKSQPEVVHIEKPKQQTVVAPVQPQIQQIQIPAPVPAVQQEVKSTPAPTAGELTEAMRPQSLQLDEDEKPISMFYLLQHYNKTNAAKYKAQKAAKKGKKGEAKSQNNSTVQAKAGYAIPTEANKQPDLGFAVPGQSSVPVVAKPAPQPTVNPQPVVKPAQPNVAQQKAQPVMQQSAQAISFGETTVLGSPMGETTVLGAAAAAPTALKPYLIREKNNEKIPLNKPVFRIGKERSYVDYFIGDNTAISRSHANIVSHNGEYFVVDTNSTNHTYVDGIMIQSNVETAVSSGTIIRLANEEFEFRLM